MVLSPVTSPSLADCRQEALGQGPPLPAKYVGAGVSYLIVSESIAGVVKSPPIAVDSADFGL